MICLIIRRFFKDTCVRQVVLDKWLPLTSAEGHPGDLAARLARLARPGPPRPARPRNKVDQLSLLNYLSNYCQSEYMISKDELKPRVLRGFRTLPHPQGERRLRAHTPTPPLDGGGLWNSGRGHHYTYTSIYTYTYTYTYNYLYLLYLYPYLYLLYLYPYLYQYLCLYLLCGWADWGNPRLVFLLAHVVRAWVWHE